MGTVRGVAQSTTGVNAAVVNTLQYDSFGKIVSQSNASKLPRWNGSKIWVHKESDEMITTSNAVSETFEGLYGRGTELLRPLIVESRSISQDDLLQGLDCVERALKIEPQSWPASWVLGRAYTIVGDLERAHRMFRLTYQLNPTDKNVGRELGLSLLRLSCSQLALLVFNDLVSRFANDHSLIANLGLCYWMSGLECVERALSLNKNETSQELRRKIIGTLENGVSAPSHLEW